MTGLLKGRICNCWLAQAHYHSCHLYAVRREYTERKLTENIECEIMHVVVEEAYESYRYAMPVFAVCNHWVAACARWSYAHRDDCLPMHVVLMPLMGCSKAILCMLEQEGDSADPAKQHS